MELLVKGARRADVYRRTIRIPEAYREDVTGKKIPEGSVCKVTVTGKAGVKTARVAIRGLEKEPARIVRVDEITRLALGIEAGEKVEIQARVEGLLG